MDAMAILRQSAHCGCCDKLEATCTANTGSVRVNRQVFHEVGDDIPKLCRVLNKFVRNVYRGVTQPRKTDDVLDSTSDWRGSFFNPES